MQQVRRKILLRPQREALLSHSHLLTADLLNDWLTTSFDPKHSCPDFSLSECSLQQTSYICGLRVSLAAFTNTGLLLGTASWVGTKRCTASAATMALMIMMNRSFSSSLMS